MKRLFFLPLLVCVAAASRADDARVVTYHRDIEPIFQQKCQECHRPNELAPMSMLNYSQVRPWAKSIRQAVAEKEMPPWDAAPGYGPFKGDYSLTGEEHDLILAWVDQGALRGDPADAPPPVQWDESGWRAGVPDVILEAPEPIIIPPTEVNEDLYQCIVLGTPFEKDTWIKGFEYKIDNRKVTHHIIGFIDTTGKNRELDEETPGYGFPCSMGGGVAGGSGLSSMLGGWAPGTQPNMMHPGQGMMIPANADIVFNMHYYNQTGLEQEDRPALGLHLADAMVHKKARIFPVSAWNINIPAGDPNAEHRARWKIRKPIDIYYMMPHMHSIGKDMTLSIDFPDGRNETILDVPRYDFDWQLIYTLVEPIHVPRGSTVHMLSHHDNSADNPDNPSSPPVDMSWGESTTEEMAIGWFGYVYSEEDLGIDPGE